MSSAAVVVSVRCKTGPVNVATPGKLAPAGGRGVVPLSGTAISRCEDDGRFSIADGSDREVRIIYVYIDICGCEAVLG